MLRDDSREETTFYLCTDALNKDEACKVILNIFSIFIIVIYHQKVEGRQAEIFRFLAPTTR